MNTDNLYDYFTYEPTATDFDSLEHRKLRNRFMSIVKAKPEQLERAFVSDIIVEVLDELSWVSKQQLDAGLRERGIKSLKASTLHDMVTKGILQHREDQFGNTVYRVHYDNKAIDEALQSDEDVSKEEDKLRESANQ